MGTRAPSLRRLFHRLHHHYGPQHWWPGETPFEVMLGAILTQHTSWRNVEHALKNLKRRGLVHPRRLARLPERRLARLIRPAGSFRVKARRVKAFLAYLERSYQFDLDRMRRQPPGRLRRELLEVEGIGPETADSILLYALGKPVFVVDRYTRRIFARHGLLSPQASYEEGQRFFQARLPPRAPLFNEFHALLVRLGKDRCRSAPRCRECPLEPDLPPGGPLGISRPPSTSLRSSA